MRRSLVATWSGGDFAGLDCSVTMRPMLTRVKKRSGASTRFPQAWQSGATRLSKALGGAR
jgi:hypothetical protein